MARKIKKLATDNLANTVNSEAQTAATKIALMGETKMTTNNNNVVSAYTVESIEAGKINDAIVRKNAVPSMKFVEMPVRYAFTGEECHARYVNPANGIDRPIDYRSELTISTAANDSTVMHDMTGSNRYSLTKRMAMIGAALGLKFSYMPAAGMNGRYLLLTRDAIEGKVSRGFLGMIKNDYFGTSDSITLSIADRLLLNVEYPFQYEGKMINGAYIQWYALFAATSRTAYLKPLGMGNGEYEVVGNEFEKVFTQEELEWMDNATYEVEKIEKRKSYNAYYVREYFAAMSLLAEGTTYKFSINAVNHDGSDKPQATRRDDVKFSFEDLKLVFKVDAFKNRIGLTCEEYKEVKNTSKYDSLRANSAAKNMAKNVGLGNVERVIVEENGVAIVETHATQKFIENESKMSNFALVKSGNFVAVYDPATKKTEIVSTDSLEGVFSVAYANESSINGLGELRQNKAVKTTLSVHDRYGRQQIRRAGYWALIRLG